MALELAFTDSAARPSGDPSSDGNAVSATAATAPDARRPIVILHGLFGSGSNWRSISRMLAARHRVLCVDLRNHGRSPWSEWMDYPSMAEDVGALIERLELAEPIVVGHSMGGKAAMALALTQPQRVGRLVVVDIAPVSYTDRFTPYIEAMRNAAAVQSASRSEVQRRLEERVHDSGITGFLMQNLVSRNDHFDWRVNLGVISAAMGVLSSFPGELLERRNDGPATFIHGERSDYVKERDHDLIRRLFPAARFSTIAQAGHWVHADQPAAFLDALAQAIGDGSVADVAG